ncbi:MAG: restriction endonuclease subunit S [Micrococcales bacterium]|nr:restriction endonuclease subunit S [Micrococcales bacterium]
MIRTVPLSDLLPGAGPRVQLQQGWSPQCLAHPAPETSWGVLKTTAIQSGKFVPHENKELPEHFEPRPGLEVRAGDLLLTCAGPRSRCGIPALVRTTRPRLMISGKMYRFRPNPDVVDSRYLELYLQSPAAQALIDAMKTGISDSGLNLTKERFLGLPVPIAPLPEQRRIVDILEDHLSRLDAAHDYLAAATLREQALVRAVLTDAIPEVNDYPAGWATATVAEAGRVELGRQRHPDWHHGANMRPYLRVANVFEDRIDTADLKEMHWPDHTFERFRLQPGDVLLNEGQSPEFLGRPAIYRGIPESIAFTNSLIRFVAHETVRPEFALLVFRRHMHAGRFRRESRITTNIAHLSATRLKAIEFPIPPLEVQDSIVSEVTQQLDALGVITEQVRAARLRAQALRRSLLHSAFTGHLTGQSPDLGRSEELAFS